MAMHPLSSIWNGLQAPFLNQKKYIIQGKRKYYNWHKPLREINSPEEQEDTDTKDNLIAYLVGMSKGSHKKVLGWCQPRFYWTTLETRGQKRQTLTPLKGLFGLLRENKGIEKAVSIAGNLPDHLRSRSVLLQPFHVSQTFWNRYV